MSKGAEILYERPSPGLEKFVLSFYEDRCEEFSQVKTKFLEEDFNFISLIAHKWKGFCSPYGFHKLEKLSLDLEKACKSNETAQIKNLIEEISVYLCEKEKLIK